MSTLAKLKSEMESEFPKLEIIVHAASVTDEAAIRSIVRSSGKIDIVVSAAAICHTTTPPSTIAASELSEILQTNTVGPFLVISTILHERSIRGWDHEVKVIYVSSALSHTHICHLSGYAASKAAMNLLCLHLSIEWGSRGVSVFAIHPGLIYTTLTGKVFPKDSPIWEDGKSHLITFSPPFCHYFRIRQPKLQRSTIHGDADVFYASTASLSAGFCVWLCHPEAAFLSGKVLWAQWDVPELLAQKEWIEKNPWHLEIGLNLPTTERPTEDFFVVDTRIRN